MKMQFMFVLMVLLATAGCNNWDEDALDVDFDIPRTESFPDNLSEYGLFEGEMRDLIPAQGTHLYELNSELYTDYAGKQRLVRVPVGEAVTLDGDRPTYPDGTVLAKTFYFDHDLRDAAKGRHIVETRLLIKVDGLWNVATYLWNEDQTEASLSLDGSTAAVDWLDKNGQPQSTDHEIPSEVACVTCHQVNDVATPIGPRLKNLDREVQRGSETINQIRHLNALGLLPSAEPSATMVDYRDASKTLETRTRSYLDINCAHCHNPDAWERSARQELDLRYEATLAETGISEKIRPLREQLRSGDMPFIGTTLRHDEGVDLVLEYLETL